MGDPGVEDGGWPLRPEMIEVCRLLRRHMPTALLSNTVPEWREGLRRRVDMDALFDVVVESSEVGMRKPEPRIYALLEERLGLPGEALLFVDDLGSNLRPARARGWRTIKFESATPVLQLLSEFAHQQMR